MMYAIHIELFDQFIRDPERKTGVHASKDLWAESDEFIQAVRRRGFESPSGAAQITDTRFRLFLRVPGRPEMNGVYYVGGWLDEGLVHLCWDDEQDYVIPRRREAIEASRGKF